jgi:hypothetical protein
LAQNGQAVAKAILKYDQLTKEQQAVVMQKLSRKSLRRTPATSARSFPVMSRVVKAAGTYGGALYIDFGKGARLGKRFQVKIKNALAAPYFVLGKTTVAEWKRDQRNAAVPYAEFVSDRVAFSFPSIKTRDGMLYHEAMTLSAMNFSSACLEPRSATLPLL